MAVRSIFDSRDDPIGIVRKSFAHIYWRPRRAELTNVGLAVLGWPIFLAYGMITFTARNGRIVAARHGRPIPLQLLDQFRLYFAHGILPRWYYIFSLYERGPRDDVRGFINRFETKGGVFTRLNAKGTSPLQDKLGFFERCTNAGLSTAPILLASVVKLGNDQTVLPNGDLFIKPTKARGGRGAERWEWIDGDRYRRSDGVTSTAAEIARRISDSVGEELILQPRLINHPSILDLSNGALNTLRFMTCLNEEMQPEIIGAAFRMAIGRNVTVDNFHAGGIAAAVDLVDGRLSKASNLGADVRLGWLSKHPDTGAAIEGRILPCWEQTCELAKQAHLAFSDRIIIGWDIAILADGPCLIEGNVSPDIDIMQRVLSRGLGNGRLGALLAYHLKRARIENPSPRR